MLPPRENYFDNAATTPLDPRVAREMRPFFEERCGNPSSIHAWGRQAREAVALARTRVAALVGAEDPAEIVFTAGASESNNWVLSQFDSGAVGPFEHPSVSEVAQSRGFEPLRQESGRILPPTTRPEIVSVMAVQNEFGAVFSLGPLRPWAERTHSDVTQSLGKLRFDIDALDFASFSAHKLYGPMGAGGLYRRGTVSMKPLLFGGGQENGQRAGTLNVPGIVGLGMACALALEEAEADAAHARELRAIVQEELAKVPDTDFVEFPEQSPFILAVLFRGLIGESLVLDLDRKGFAASAGSACSSGHAEPWASLTALGYEPEWSLGAVRLSFGRFNTRGSAHAVAVSLADSARSLRQLR